MAGIFFVKWGSEELACQSQSGGRVKMENGKLTMRRRVRSFY